ncbi:hypothetical protein D9M70_570590 [compost metagenome]
MPAISKKDFEPRVEIHRRRMIALRDVGHVAVHIARRHVHAAAEGDRQMRIVAADADAILMGFERGAHCLGIAVAEDQALMHIVANRLHALPTGRHISEQSPRERTEPIRFAVTAGREIG